MSSNCIQLCRNTEIPGEFLMIPLKSFTKYMKEETQKAEGWTKAAWIINHIALGVFAYPIFGLLAGIGISVKFIAARNCGVREIRPEVSPLNLTKRVSAFSELHKTNEEMKDVQTSQLHRELTELKARLDFPPYKLNLEIPGKGEKTYSISSQEDEKRVIQELEQWVNQNFKSIKINSGIFSKDFCQGLKGFERVRAAFENRFNLHQKDGSTSEWLGPKPVAEETLGENLKKMRYANGIEDVWRFSKGGWQIETRCDSNGEYEFFSPKIVGSPIDFSGKKYLFAPVKIDEKEQLVLLEKDKESYRIFKQSPLPVLFTPTWLSNSLIKEVMDYPIAIVSPAEIVQYAFENKEDGEPRIFSFPEGDVLALLRQAQKLHIPFDFQKPSPHTNKTLFAKWVVQGSAELLQCMLEMDPTCIDQTTAQQTSFIRQILNRGCGYEKIELLKEAMKARNIPLSINDLWAERIYQGDTSFEDKEFLALDPTLQKELYSIAHACSYIELVDRMNQLGMKQQPVSPRGPTPLSVNMDLLEQRKAIESCLLKLRKEKRILLAEEVHQNLESFHNNQNDFSRVLGAAFVKETVQKLGLKYIDATETFAVLTSDLPSIRIHTALRSNNKGPAACIQSIDKMNIYAERIVEVERFVSLEEVYELLDAIEATGFTDIHRSNFMVTKDKIYFVDLEWTNFEKHAHYGLMQNLLGLVKPEDRDALLANINKRSDACQKKVEENKALLEEKENFEKQSFKMFFGGKRSYEFPSSSLLSLTV